MLRDKDEGINDPFKVEIKRCRRRNTLITDF